MDRFKGIFYAVVSAVSFGLVPLFTMPILSAGSMGRPSILFYRFGIAAAVIGLAGAFLGRSFRVSARMLCVLAVLGFLYAATSLGLIFSYMRIPTGTATTLHFLYPVLVAFMMAAFFGERASPAVLGAAVLSLAGVALMTFGGGLFDAFGTACALGTVATYALYIVGVRATGAGKMDSIVLTFYVLAFGSAMFAAFAAASGGVEGIGDAGTFLNLFLLALIPTVISDFTLVLAVKRAGPTVTAVLGSFEPLAALLAGFIFFSEPLGVSAVCGFLLIVSGVIAVVLSSEGEGGGPPRFFRRRLFFLPRSMSSFRRGFRRSGGRRTGTDG